MFLIVRRYFYDRFNSFKICIGDTRSFSNQLWFYREENIVKFERKVFRFIKRAVKITVNEIRESRKSKTNGDNIVELRSEDDIEAQYDYLLKKVG